MVFLENFLLTYIATVSAGKGWFIHQVHSKQRTFWKPRSSIKQDKICSPGAVRRPEWRKSQSPADMATVCIKEQGQPQPGHLCRRPLGNLLAPVGCSSVLRELCAREWGGAVRSPQHTVHSYLRMEQRGPQQKQEQSEGPHLCWAPTAGAWLMGSYKSLHLTLAAWVSSHKT